MDIKNRKEYSPSPKVKALMIDFLSFYSKIIDIKKDDELSREWPNIKPAITELFSQQQLVTKTNSEIKVYNFDQMRADTFIYSKCYTKTICFLRHMRNAIAHWNIEPHSEMKNILIIQDFNKQKQPTCYGLIKNDTFEKLLNINNSKIYINGK